MARSQHLSLDQLLATLLGFDPASATVVTLPRRAPYHVPPGLNVEAMRFEWFVGADLDPSWVRPPDSTPAASSPNSKRDQIVPWRVLRGLRQILRDVYPREETPPGEREIASAARHLVDELLSVRHSLPFTWSVESAGMLLTVSVEEAVDPEEHQLALEQQWDETDARFDLLTYLARAAAHRVTHETVEGWAKTRGRPPTAAVVTYVASEFEVSHKTIAMIAALERTTTSMPPGYTGYSDPATRQEAVKRWRTLMSRPGGTSKKTST